MKILSLRFTLLLTLACANSLWAIFPQTKPSSRVKADASCWKFRNAQELDSLIVRCKNKPRSLYYIVSTAINRGMAPDAANSLEKLVNNDRFNNSLRAFLAYSYWGAENNGGFGGKDWYKYNGLKQGAFTWLQVIVEEKDQKQVTPEMLVIAGSGLSMELFGAQRSYRKEEIPDRFSPILQSLRRAIALDPQWADARYWYGFALEEYFDSLPHLPMENKRHLLSRAEQSLLTAQRLDPNLKGSCARLLSGVVEKQGRNTAALRYLDIWFEAQPRYAKNDFHKKRRTQLIATINAKKDDR